MHMQVTQLPDGDWVCEHGTAVDVHCCNCHSGFLFDLDACVCVGSWGVPMSRLRRAWHVVQHWLGLEPCMNFTEWRGDRLWHVVICCTCGHRVLTFPSRITRKGLLPRG
jgi:hypothetical protein